MDETYKTYYVGPTTDHFDGEQFFNPWGPRPKKGIWDVFKWRMEGNRALWPESIANDPRNALEPASIRPKVTYIGHATFLVQAGGVNLLIDPVFSERVSPFAHIGPKRIRPPFVGWDALPKIDYVFVSHNHYDHLDLPSLAWLARNHKPVFITPLGNTRHIRPCVESCSMVALDWHDETPLGNGLSLTLTPAQHWSRRGLNDINRDLWGGCFIKTVKGPSLYYSGDSGFDAGVFQDIHDRHGAPDIAMLPIGAYEPRWFMKYSHMNPQEAVKVFQILKAKLAIAFHFETFQLTDEAFDAPRKATIDALKAASIDENRFLIPYPGDFLNV